jgi:hypothetical protein
MSEGQAEDFLEVGRTPAWPVSFFHPSPTAHEDPLLAAVGPYARGGASR